MAGAWFFCPYLDADVELTEERERHIVDRHPELLADLHIQVGETLVDADRIMLSAGSGSALLFARLQGIAGKPKHAVVVVKIGYGIVVRRWILTE